MIPTAPAPLLLVTDHPGLQAEVARLAAAANVALATVGPASVPHRWRTAPAVLVGDDVAWAVADLAPGRREEVWLVASGPVDGAALRAGLVLGAGGVVELPVGAAELGSWMGDLGDGAEPGPVAGRTVVGVLGASGGVGSSVLALAIAEVAAASGDSVLVDLDPWGLPAAALSGAAPEGSAPPVSWDDLDDLDGRLGARALRESLPARGRLRVLGWGPTSRAVAPPTPVVREVVGAARRGHGRVVLDVPRSDTVRETLALCDAVVVVAGSTLAGTAGAARAAALVPDGVPAGVVVRSARGTWPDDVARLTGLPRWATLGPQRGLGEHLAAGLGAVRSSRSPCARAARAVLAAVDGHA